LERCRSLWAFLWALGKIKPNGFYGFPIAKTLNNESVCYKVNEFAGKAFISSGSAIITLTFVALWLGNLLFLGPAHNG
jgi:hypothetical protein